MKCITPSLKIKTSPRYSISLDRCDNILKKCQCYVRCYTCIQTDKHRQADISRLKLNTYLNENFNN